jgi:glycosyltransferase involved in cell wall biosynthesis
VLAQKTDFDFEIVIGEDHSSDQTFSICQTYAEKHPEKIKLLKRTQNLGLPENLIQSIAAAKGTYIAFQEGDDYWTNPLKLQQQIDILKYDKQLVACTHNVKVLGIEGEKLLIRQPGNYYSIKDSENGRIFHTNSWVVKKEVVPDFRHYHNFLICWDILMELKILEKGKVHCINDTYSVWRKHEEGNSVKIPLLQQFSDFENLYMHLLQEAKDSGNRLLIKHYQVTLCNFYKIFTLEIARREKKIYFKGIQKACVWQLKTMKPDILYTPRLAWTYLISQLK